LILLLRFFLYFEDSTPMKEKNLNSLLPTEIILNILKFLNPTSLLNVQKTNTELSAITQDPVWCKNYLKSSELIYLKSRSLIKSFATIKNPEEGEKNIISSIVNSDNPEWQNLDVFINFLKEKCQPNIAKHLDQIKVHLVKDLKRDAQNLHYKDQKEDFQSYNNIVFFLFSLEKLEENLAFLSCCYLLRSEHPLSKSLELITEKGGDKILTGNDLLLLDAYMNNNLITFLLDSKNQEYLRLLTKLKAPHWSQYINDQCLFGSYSLINAMKNKYFMPELDGKTIKTLLQNDPDARKVMLANPQFCSLTDKKYLLFLTNLNSTTSQVKKKVTDQVLPLWGGLKTFNYKSKLN
jgi:F-box domain